MIFGLGSNSTIKHPVDRLGELLQPGKVHNIIGISENTHQQVIDRSIFMQRFPKQIRKRRLKEGKCVEF
ncbi:putative ribose-5-phosphate isomerase [Rosa chinensis]|uniref:Putative ribose-5-phosphate isomerase n=1 Tax=Rosa chinensis TaxID=74649 RepID=A0A2P6R4G5_ROSCH|nr:putative ribose-5-phosphate isomerase [Rosa chinensis]